jgi:hypothetical protein
VIDTFPTMEFPAPSRLCGACNEGLRININEGFGTSILDGCRYLEEDERWGLLPQQESGYYKIRDVPPQLPFLLASANGGCAFCKLLRDIILSDDISELDDRCQKYVSSWSGQVILIRLRYFWQPDENVASGLGMLSLEAYVNCPGSAEDANFNLVFYAKAIRGASTTRCQSNILPCKVTNT